MYFKRINPSTAIREFIQCYWIIEDDNRDPVQQKIIPDGFPEIIFHYGDPYKILIGKNWELQDNYLLAGQVRTYFYLENTGKTKTFGIKFKPAAITYLLNLSMKEYVDRVVSLNNVKQKGIKEIKTSLSCVGTWEEIVLQLNHFFEKLVLANKPSNNPLSEAIHLIFKRNGMVTNAELCVCAGVGERQLLNQFREFIGLSPKFYARVIRLNYIFQLVKKDKEKWSSLIYEAAYFDQAHFIKDFKKFTGERPGKYSFNEKNMANFFLLPGQ